MQLRVDYLHASRYRERTTGDQLHPKDRTGAVAGGQDLLIIDDISTRVTPWMRSSAIAVSTHRPACAQQCWCEE